MKLYYLIVAGALLLATNLSAQTEGGIDEKMLNEIRQGYTATSAQKAVRNALASNSIAVLATNGENLAMIDTHFTPRVKTVGITDQP